MKCLHPFVRDERGKIHVLSQILGDAKKEFVENLIPFPCGQCLACRINRRREWTIRLIMELYEHEAATFVTLTYSDEDLPYSLEGLPSLCKRDLQLFHKRLRKAFSQKLRFYACGEYGSKTFRPHYHGIYFGVSPDELDDSWMMYEGKSGAPDGMYRRSSTLSRLWSHGIVHVGEVTKDSIQYVAGYVTKKLGKKGEYYGRKAEFSLQSRRPGIGGLSEDCIRDAIGETAREAPPESFVGKQVRYDGKLWPLGRYLRNKLSDAYDSERDWDAYLDRVWNDFKSSRKTHKNDWLTFVDDSRAQTGRNIEARAKIFNTRGGI